MANEWAPAIRSDRSGRHVSAYKLHSDCPQPGAAKRYNSGRNRWVGAVFRADFASARPFATQGPKPVHKLWMNFRVGGLQRRKNPAKTRFPPAAF